MATANTEFARLDSVEKEKIEAILNAPVLPTVSADDNGSFLAVSGGKWVVVEQMENIADSTATSVAQIKTDFNALLKALQDVGLMAEPEEEEET